MTARRALVIGGLAVALLGLGSLALIWRLQGGPSTTVGTDAPAGVASTSAPAAPGPPLAAPSAAPSPFAPPASGDAATAPAERPAPPARISSRKHRARSDRRELLGVPLEVLATQLMAGLNDFKAEIETCSRKAPGDASAGHSAAAEAATLIRALVTQAGLTKGQLTVEEEKVLRDLETAKRASAPRRTLMLDVQMLDGQARIVDVPAGQNGSADDPLVMCARQVLSGKVLPVAVARAGSRIPVAFPLGSAGEPAPPAMNLAQEAGPEASLDAQEGQDDAQEVQDGQAGQDIQ